MIPKGAKYGNKVFVGKVANERVRELLDDTDPKTTFLPETISIVDLDTEMLNVLNNGNLSVVSESGIRNGYASIVVTQSLFSTF